ncbi:MAG: glycosyltransferase family 39 protein [Myxococcota bacterium]
MKLGAPNDRVLCAGLFFASFLTLFLTERAVGFTRDESVYFAAAESYAGWFKLLAREPAVALTDGAITRAFDFNHEHPVLMKSLFGLSYLLFHEGLGWVRPATAFRIPAFAVAALIPVLVFLLGRDLYGRKAGLFAALSFFLVPRQFFNAHLACFDVPMAATWLFTVYAFWRAQSAPRWWAFCGVAFGLALATKHNALFLPFVLTPFALWSGWRQSASSPQARRLFLQLVGLFAAVGVLYGLLLLALGPIGFQASFRVLSPPTALFLGLAGGSSYLLLQLYRTHLPSFRAVAAVPAMAVLGPVLFYLLWPYLWHSPVERVAWWFSFHARHEHYTWFYLGELLREPPFPLAYVVVKTALTVPLTLFLPMVLGLFAVVGRTVLARWKKGMLPSFGEALVVVNALTAIAIISHPSVPHFGGVKHWFPSMPFLAILAGYIVARVSAVLPLPVGEGKGEGHHLAQFSLLSVLLLTPPLIATARVHPYGTAYYSELAGGLPGAASLGMQRQFWSSHVTGVLEWLNQHAPPGARVYLHEVNGFSFRDYQRNGMLRRDLVPTGGPFDAQFAVYQYHQEFRESEFQMWQAFGTTTPVAGLYVDETPQIVVYRRP